ncbi:Alpha/Beta hydrolase protein [Lipomyces oligophaga]|uniref:Alpha/Beta hydrolase protein n=1 Tax=Lipomyces oligophaga TaxID=45792 RepID=UPI0034CF2ED5
MVFCAFFEITAVAAVLLCVSAASGTQLEGSDNSSIRGSTPANDSYSIFTNGTVRQKVIESDNGNFEISKAEGSWLKGKDSYQTPEIYSVIEDSINKTIVDFSRTFGNVSSSFLRNITTFTIEEYEEFRREEEEDEEIFYDPKAPNMMIEIEPNRQIEFPIIDFGYIKYRATSYRRHGHYFTFKDVRYAAPPTGTRRFQRPQPPFPNGQIQNGGAGFQCHQAQNLLYKWTDLFNADRVESEDCLFMDLKIPGENFGISPKWSRRRWGRDVEGPVASLVWIHGGGFVHGSKDGIYNPHGIMTVARGRMIFVSFNYRLGAYGFLAGSEMNEHDGTNLGLLDQRQALDWLKQYLPKFGGDPDRITVMGQGSGAASIMHHLTATEKPAFNKAIIMSPSYYPIYDQDTMDKQFQDFSNLAGCNVNGKQFDCLKQLGGKALSTANRAYALRAKWGTNAFGPFVDGKYVPALPSTRFSQGRFHSDVKVMLSFSQREGDAFADPAAILEFQTKPILRNYFPNASEETIQDMVTYYPNRIDEPLRLSNLMGDFMVKCNVRMMEEAFSNKVHVIEYLLNPGTHGIDLLFTFWGLFWRPTYPFLHLGDNSYSKEFMDIMSRYHQQYIVSFTVWGWPSAYSTCMTPFYPTCKHWTRSIMMYTQNGPVVGSMAGFGPNKHLCKFWQEGDFAGDALPT